MPVHIINIIPINELCYLPRRLIELLFASSESNV